MLATAEWSRAQLSVTVDTDQDAYVVGEPLAITVTARNAGDSPLVLHFSSSLQTQYVLDSTFESPNVGLTVLTSATVPAHGVHDWTYSHSWDHYDLSVGAHSVVGRLLRDLPNYIPSAAEAFHVVAPAPVVNDVQLDFESYADGTPTRGDDGSIPLGFWRQAYAAAGVEFRSHGGRVGLAAGTGDNTVIRAGSGSHPFNIVAEFAMPVYGVSADVGAAANCTVNLSAFDAGGNLIGSVISPPVTSYPHLVGPLAFSSATPIASVQWVASNPLSAVLLDNLQLDVDGVSAVIAAGDYNRDGRVDGSDLIVWQQDLGEGVGSPGQGADGDRSGKIDAGDLGVWQQAMALPAANPAATVPEPAASALSALGVAIATRRRRRI